MDDEKKDDEKKDNLPAYKVPEKVAVADLQKADANDASLNKMKEQLLGKDTDRIFDEKNPGSVLFDSLVILPTGQKEVILTPKELSPDIIAFVLKQNCEYCTAINFKVQREIVMCLKAHNIIKRKGVTVKTYDQVVGSYAPGKEYTKKFDLEIAPKGLLGRGVYLCRTILRDDDTVHYTFEYRFKIGKDWE